MGAKDVGIVYSKRSSTTITIQLNGQQQEDYEALIEFPFDSTRKRMSLIVKSANRYYVMCKGADSIMMPRVKIDIQTQQKIEQDLYKFAVDGLRTLVFSKKEITQSEYEDFYSKYTSIKTSIDSQKEQKLGVLYD